MGAPPACRPECTISAECPSNQACSNQRCINPCIGSCGVNAECKVVNHNPICTCPASYTGEPFSRCMRLRKYIKKYFCTSLKVHKTALCKILFYVIIIYIILFCYSRTFTRTSRPMYTISMWTEFPL